MEFTLPNNFNGQQFAEEIKLSFFDVWVNENKIFVNAPENRFAEIEEKLKIHKPKTFIDHKKTAFAKLAALGLTEDEIAAL